MTDKLKDFNYNIKYTKGYDCVLINPKDWEENTSNLVTSYNVHGDVAMNYLTKVLKTNIDEEVFGNPLDEGDLVLLTRVASRIGYLKPYELPINNNTEKYSNIHVMQVIGKFKDYILDIEHLQPLFDKVVMEKLELDISDTIYAGEKETTTVGIVKKTGSGGFTSKWKPREMEVQVDDAVLLRDNITTNVRLGHTDYICTEDSMIIGKFKHDIISMDFLEVYQDFIIMEEKQEEKAQGSDILYNPVYNLDEEDISDVYLHDRFTVINKSSKITDVEVGDVVVVSRDTTNYVILKGKKYFVISGIKDIEAIVKKQGE